MTHHRFQGHFNVPMDELFEAPTEGNLRRRDFQLHRRRFRLVRRRADFSVQLLNHWARVPLEVINVIKQLLDSTWFVCI